MYAIKAYAISQIKEMKDKANILYEKMQDWINYSFKRESEDIDDNDYILRDFIEQ